MESPLARLTPEQTASLAAALDAIEALATDHATREAMGTAAHEKAVREFDQQRQIDITLALYADLLRGVAAR